MEPVNAADLLSQARQAYQQRALDRTEALCKQVLDADPASAAALNLLGLTYQAAERHEQAIAMYSQAIAIDRSSPSYHFNIAHSYERVNRSERAIEHFKAALVASANSIAVENFIMRDQTVVGCVQKSMTKSKLPAVAIPFDARDISDLAKNLLLRSAMQTVQLRGVELEYLFTHLRLALLDFCLAGETGDVPDDVAGLFCALAEQCFINEHLYCRSEMEATNALQLRDRLVSVINAGGGATPILIAAVAAYFPLHRLPNAKTLLSIDHPQCVVELLVRQVREPLEETQDVQSIPALTPIADPTSIQVMNQYEENPYPRWTVMHTGEAANVQPDGSEILVAGCGTGRHAFEVALQFPAARILAVDISRTSLAYARRKVREYGLGNIEFAQADILNLALLGRSFDRIESVGVLHHLANPEDGLRALLSLLKPGGELRLGLYSEAARSALSIVAAREFIASGGYQSTAEGIRSFRQAIIARRNEPRWKPLVTTLADFYSMSGCRDLLFNIMEHRYTIPQVAALLTSHRLTLVDFQADAPTLDQFRRQYPAVGAELDLGNWAAFEKANPQSFHSMYIFTVNNNGHAVQ